MAIAKFFKVRRVPKAFSSFTGFVRRPAAILGMAARNKKLRSAIEVVFNKKTLGVTAGVGAVTYGATQVAAYIRENSGCFVHDDAGGGAERTCKLLNLSCCQPQEYAGMSSCAAFDTAPPGACAGYDDDDDEGGGGGSCCRLCDCEFHGCLPSQRMECRKATVGEALTYYSQGAGGLVSDTLGSFLGGVFESFPYVRHFLWACVLAAVVLFVSALFR